MHGWTRRPSARPRRARPAAPRQRHPGRHRSTASKSCSCRSSAGFGRLQQVGQQGAKRPPPTAGPLDQALGPVQLLDVAQQAQHRGEGQPGLAHRDAQPPDDVHPAVAPGQRRGERFNQRGLAQSGLTRKQNDAATGGHSRVELFPECRQLDVTAYEAGGSALRNHAPSWHRSGAVSPWRQGRCSGAPPIELTSHAEVQRVARSRPGATTRPCWLATRQPREQPRHRGRAAGGSPSVG